MKTSKEWLEITGEQIMDPDGWRTNTINGEGFAVCNFNHTLITRYEFDTRLRLCTRLITPNNKADFKEDVWK